jgi:hypothetical protein
MTILYTVLVMPSYISITIFDENSTSNSKSLSTNDGPWGSSLEREAILDLLPGGVLKGGVYGAGVKVIILLFYACFKLGAKGLHEQLDLQQQLPSPQSLNPSLPSQMKNPRCKERGRYEEVPQESGSNLDVRPLLLQLVALAVVEHCLC